MMNRMGRGYLENDFCVYCLKDVPSSIIPMHYHDFHQIMVLLDGSIEYAVEEQKYQMEAGDVMLVEAGSMHRPIIPENTPYKRIIIDLTDSFFAARPGLNELFVRAEKKNNFLLTVPSHGKCRLTEMAGSLLDSACSSSRLPLLLQKSRMNEFLIELNDVAASADCGKNRIIPCHESVRRAIRYINEHLTGDLSTERIAEETGLTGTYLMHLFKKETGKTLRSFITEKRLFLSGCFLNDGRSAAEACTLSGFSSYSSFYRAYMERYGTSPRTVTGNGLPEDAEPTE